MVEDRELGVDAAAKATQRALREAGDFATTGGVADMDRVGQVELRDGRREVVGIRVHVIAVPWLAHAPVPTAVMGDAAVAAGGEKHHLVFPGVGAQWPTMAEHHGLAAAPVHLAEGDSAAVAPAPGITGSAAVAPIAVPPITRSQRAAPRLLMMDVRPLSSPLRTLDGRLWAPAPLERLPPQLPCQP